MTLNCRISRCQWRGHQDYIFDHLESQHKKFLREPKGNMFFDFNFDDLQQEILVLCSPNGLYWFRQKLPNRTDGIDFGVFHIGDSEQVRYVLKVGLKRDGHCEYWGPYDSEQDSEKLSSEEEEYRLKFDFKDLETFNEAVPSRRLRIYFGEYDDSDDKICPTPQDMIWEEGDIRVNNMLVERFTCCVCLDYVRRNARFCANSHVICLQCLEKMQKRMKLKCPICRGLYFNDCEDPDIERLLGMVKWPDTPEVEVDQELLEQLKSMPNVKFVRVKTGEHI